MPLTRYRLPTVIVLNLLTLFHYSKAADLTGVDLQNTLMAPKCAQNDNLNKNGTDGYGQVFQFQSYDICNVFLFSLALVGALPRRCYQPEQTSACVSVATIPHSQ